MFMADLVRSLEVPVICQFIKPKYQQKSNNSPESITEILFSHDGDIKGHHVLVIEGLVHSGVTGEFLMSDLRARGVFLKDAAGSRPVMRSHAKFEHDPHFKDLVLFSEYFHGDTGRGLGASHQTGWTGLVAKLLQPRRDDASDARAVEVADYWIAPPRGFRGGTV